MLNWIIEAKTLFLNRNDTWTHWEVDLSCDNGQRWYNTMRFDGHNSQLMFSSQSLIQAIQYAERHAEEQE